MSGALGEGSSAGDTAAHIAVCFAGQVAAVGGYIDPEHIEAALSTDL